MKPQIKMYINPAIKERNSKNMGKTKVEITNQQKPSNKTQQSNTVQDKLTQLRGMTADEILQKYEETDGLAVDIAKILYNLDIQVMPLDFTELEKSEPISKLVQKKGIILGIVLIYAGKLSIFYRKGSSRNRARFTLAHELAHCCKHIKENVTDYMFRMDESSDDEKEKEANIFAGELLIPEDRLLYAYNKLILPYSSSLAKLFYVSVNVMEARLKYLELPYYNIRNEYIG